jgi:filamentous hemagglutinin family protein
MKTFCSTLIPSSLVLIGSLFTAINATAQITPDGSTPTTVTPDGDRNIINNGARAGRNLFHSFRDFSLPNGGEAFFNNALDVRNIINRVTGGNISNIDGLLRAKGSANLFLINPAGIIFGPNARLNIGGSFLGSTADSLLFDDGTEFSATDRQTPILTINAPIGLNLRDNPAPIANNSTASADLDPSVTFDDNLFGLRVPDGKSFVLAGGNITANGGGIVSVGGRIELGSVSQEGILGLNLDGDNLSLVFSEALQRGDVSLTNDAGFLVSGSGGGDIAITARNLDISGSSNLTAGIFPGLGSPDAQAGDIRINATNSITVAQDSRVNNNVDEGASGNGGSLLIETESLKVADGGNISASTFGQGNAGNLTIRASESVEISGERPEARSGTGSPGGLFAQVDLRGQGNAGNLTIETQRLSVSDGSKVQVATFGQGNAGNLTIRASEIEVFNTPTFSDFTTGIFAGVETDPLTVNPSQGEAGDITIETERLSLRDGGKISVSTDGFEDAGNLFVKAKDLIEIFGVDPESEDGSSFLGAEVESGGRGFGGDVTIETRELIVRDGGKISVSTDGFGDAGNLTIKASDSILLSGEDSGLFAEANPEAQGRGGNLFVTTGNVSIFDNAQISAATTFGEGSNIQLQIDNNLTLRNNSLISARAFETANGGNINIDAEFVIAFLGRNDGNDIIASASEGRGGNININAQALFGLEERPQNPFTNDIDASSESNLAGNVTINTPDVEVFQETAETPKNIVESERVVAGSCNPSKVIEDILADRESGLIIKGRGGLPRQPTDPLSADLIHIEGESVEAGSREQGAEEVETFQGTSVQGVEEEEEEEEKFVIVTERTEDINPDDIVPARGMIVKENGDIILTGYPTPNVVPRTPTGSANCGSYSNRTID